ncbi:hypothetical protein CFIMG_005637RA, partial [Ceratocystis fimbriata CBS 114723]
MRDSFRVSETNGVEYPALNYIAFQALGIDFSQPAIAGPPSRSSHR